MGGAAECNGSKWVGQVNMNTVTSYVYLSMST